MYSEHGYDATTANCKCVLSSLCKAARHARTHELYCAVMMSQLALHNGHSTQMALDPVLACSDLD